MKNKLVLIRLGVLLTAILILVGLAANPFASANPPPLPTPPPTPIWKSLEPIFPPPEEPSSSAFVTTLGTVKTFHAVADTEVRQSHATENYGTEPRMGAGYDDLVDHDLIQRALLRFDTSTFLPSGTTIHQATLKLYMDSYCDALTSTFQVYRIAEDWSELTATWNNQPSLGESYASTPIPMTFGWYSFNVTDLVQAWVDGAQPEYGIMIRGPESPPYACAFREFRTKGGGGYTTAPELEVDYTAPAPALSIPQTDIVFLHQCGVGAPAPSSQVVAIQSNHATLSDWSASITGGDSWLSLNKSDGKVSRIFPDEITISVSEAITCPDTLTAQIEIGAPGLGSSPQTINVTLLQSEDPTYWIYLPLAAKNCNTGPSSSSSSASTKDRIAVFIGIADYLYADPPESFSVLRPSGETIDLLGPRTDVFGMSLMTQADFGTKVVLSDEFATKENFDYLPIWVDEREGPDTEVLFYFSGHGGPITDQPPLDEADGKDESLGVYDTQYNPEVVNLVLDDEFKTQLTNLETEHLAVIFDACNSGGMEVINTNRAVLAASQEDEASYESSELEHGVFTYFMLQAMLDPTSDTNGDGWLSVQEIYDYVHDLVYDQTVHEQSPALDLTTDFKVVRMSSTVTSTVTGQ